MLLFSLFIAGLLALIVGLFAITKIHAYRIEVQFPPIGEYVDVGGYKLHYVDLPAGENSDLPPMVFIHGASGNLRDQKLAFEEPLKGRGRMIFIDRPGHGYSERGGDDSNLPSKQAAAIAALLDSLKISKAIIVGHSFGGAITTAFAVHFPEKVKGLVFLAPATHPWPGGVSWYYDIASMPVVGYLFTELLALPAGLWQMNTGIKGVFSPNMPPKQYFQISGSELVLRPRNFRYNANDVATLHRNVTKLSPRYTEISAPTVIITGDCDDIVLAHIHSKGLERDISGARLIEFKGIGHKPDYAVNSAVIEAIEQVSR
jgi:pimeloyl-ACP methyl ester carboxylesterase